MSIFIGFGNRHEHVDQKHKNTDAKRNRSFAIRKASRLVNPADALGFGYFEAASFEAASDARFQSANS